MAKKKRKHRTPIAPPVHSAPGTVNTPSGPSTSPPPAAPVGPGTAAAPEASAARAASRPKPRRETPGSRAAAKRRRSRQRTYLVVGVVVLLIVGAIVAQQIMNRRATRQLETLGEAAGCGKLLTTGDSGAGQHLQEGETVTYDPMPPTFGKHATSTLAAGVYEEPLSEEPGAADTIYEAVHSLEHGAVIVWYDKLSDDDLDTLDREYGDEEKVIVAPFPGLRGDDHVAMTAWGRSMTCEEMSTRVIDAFIDRFREARTAPEANIPI